MEDHGYHSMGKYSSARDDLLHFLCTSDWAEESSGNSEAPTGYFWRISNDVNDVSQNNGEFNSVIGDWFAYNQEVTDSPELRAELVGHFVVTQLDSGMVFVAKYDTEDALKRDFEVLEATFYEWDEQGEG